MPLSDRPIRVLFMLQRPEAWVNIASIWSAMLENPEFDPVLWLLPYNSADPVTSEMRAPLARQLLDGKSVPYIEWRDDMFVENGRFHVAIFNHPYDRERPASLSFARIAAAVQHIIYVPYGLSVGGGFRNLRYQYSQPVHKYASAVVARSEFERDQFRRHCPSGDRHVHVIGHPRFDVLLKELEIPLPEETVQFCGNRKVFLWSSHFAFGLAHSQVSNFSTFDLIGPELFEYALENRDDVCLLWRPHPGLIPALIRDAILSKDEVQVLRYELEANGILLDESPGHALSFSASDALIADAGSFLFEYLVTGKPILALTNPDGEPLNEEGLAVVSHYRQASAPEQVKHFINEVQAGVCVEPLEDARAVHLPIFDRGAGQRVAALAKRLVNGCNAATFENTAAVYEPQSSRSPLAHKRTSASKCSFCDRSDPTPVLEKLCSELRQIRQIKFQENRMRKHIRRHVNVARSWITELLKQYPATVSWLDSMRTNRRHPPN